MAVLVLMCYLAAVCQVKNRHTQLKNTSKDTDNVLSKAQQTRAQIYAQMVPRIQGRGRGEREPFHVVICGAVAAYGCELIHWDRFDLKFQDVDGYTCSNFPTKKSHECCLDVSVGRKTLGSENFSGIKKNLRNKTAFLDTFASVETKFFLNLKLERNKQIQEQKLSVVSEQLFWLLVPHICLYSPL